MSGVPIESPVVSREPAREIRVPRSTNVMLHLFLATAIVGVGAVVVTTVQLRDDLAQARRAENLLDARKRLVERVRDVIPGIAEDLARIDRAGACGLGPDPPDVVSARCGDDVRRGRLLLGCAAGLALLFGFLAIRAGRLRIHVDAEGLRGFALLANVTLRWDEVDRFVTGQRCRGDRGGPFALLLDGRSVDLLGIWLPKRASDRVVAALVEAQRDHRRGTLR